MNILTIVSAIAGLILGVFNLFHHPAPPPQFGATVPGATPIFDTILTQQLGTSDTTMYLNSVKDVQGNTLSGYQCFTVDVNTPQVEYLCGTISGKTVTTLTRNLSYVTGTTTYATPTNIHRVGADVRITDFPSLTILSNQAQGMDTYANPLIYAAHPCTSSSASGTICDKNYIDTVATSGAPAMTTTVSGISLLATALQAASSTGTGTYNSTTYNRALWSSYATDTPQNCSTASTGGCVVMSLLNGKLNQAWLDLTQAFTWTGLHTFNTGGVIDNASSTFSATTSFAATASNKLALNGISYVWPGTQGASSTALSTDGSGNLSWEPGQVSTLFEGGLSANTAATATTTLKQVVIVANKLASNTTLHLYAQTYGFPGSSCYYEVDYGNGTATTSWSSTGANQSSIDFYLTSTSTSAEYGTFTALNGSGGNNINYLVNFSNYSLAGTTYLDVAGRSNTGGSSCYLFGEDVSVLSN